MTAPVDVPEDGPARPGGSPEGDRAERRPEPGDGGAPGGRGSLPDAPVASTGDGTGSRIVVDRDLCQGHGVCEGEAPDVFAVSKRGELTVLAETPPADRRVAVEAAIRYCPTHALSLQED